jgi:hypothetical protein
VTPQSAFAELLEQQHSAEQRESLHRLRAELGLRENDALWNFVSLLEQHLAPLRTFQPPSTSEAALTGQAPAPAAMPAWPWLCLGASAQAIFAALCVCVGARMGAAKPSWLNTGAPSALGFVSAALSVPAGWMAFVFALPCAGFAAQIGWRLRKAGEPGWGWTVFTLSVGSAAVCAFALWRLLFTPCN